MQAFPLFRHLAPELQAEVAANLDLNDLVGLNRASRTLHALTRHILYRTVDLDLVVVEPPTDAWPYQLDNAADLRAAQRMFVATLTAHPEYANYVHDLSWHVFLDEPAPPPAPISPVMVLPDFLFPGLEKALALAPMTASTSFGPRLHRPTHDFAESPVDLFKKLVMVERVRLNFSRGEISQDIPDVLFPRARAINLAGLATERLYTSILHSIGSLRELVLDHIHSPEPDFLLRLLGHLAGRCDSLERLELRKGGNARGDEPFDVVAEERTLLAFAHLANTCRPTLRHLALGLSQIVHSIVCFGVDNRPAHVRSWILPRVFAPELGPWPRLSTFTVEGVALDESDRAYVLNVSPKVQLFKGKAGAPLEQAVPMLAETPPKVYR